MFPISHGSYYLYISMLHCVLFVLDFSGFFKKAFIYLFSIVFSYIFSYLTCPRCSSRHTRSLPPEILHGSTYIFNSLLRITLPLYVFYIYNIIFKNSLYLILIYPPIIVLYPVNSLIPRDLYIWCCSLQPPVIAILPIINLLFILFFTCPRCSSRHVYFIPRLL